MAHHITIETPRLLLRPLTVADAPAVFAWGSDPEVNRYMAYPLERSVADAEAWLRQVEQADGRSDYDFGFVRKADGLLIGSGGVYRRKKEFWRRAWWVLGYNLRRDCWGQGYATEAAQAMLDFARRKRGARIFIASHAVDNPASGRVMEKCGMKCVETGQYSKLDGSETFQAKTYRLDV